MVDHASQMDAAYFSSRPGLILADNGLGVDKHQKRPEQPEQLHRHWGLGRSGKH